MNRSFPSEDNASGSASLPPVPISLQKWTAAAVNSLNSKLGKQNLGEIVCSSKYISCALKIAHSLATQLSAVEEERGYKSRHDHSALPSQHQSMISEATHKSWSKHIFVYCMAGAMRVGGEVIDVGNDLQNIFDEGNEVHTSVAADYFDTNFDPLPMIVNGNVNSHSETEDLENLAHQLSTLFDSDENNSIDYLSVRGAILNEDAVKERPLSPDGKLEIRELGIALYELFSGGQITADGEMSLTNSTRVPYDPDRASFHPLPLLSPAGSQSDALSVVGEGDTECAGGPNKRRSQGDVGLDDSISQKTMVRISSSSASTSVSVEPLKLLGLPTALCDLIQNMIDSAGDDVSNKNDREAYAFISEVRDDLKVMIDSPQIYLREIDLTKAANEGLQFGSTVFGREAELQTLKECYRRSISSECEVAMICGTSGIGKSELSWEFERSVNQGGNNFSGSIFLSGRFDKLQSQPLHAISSAFDKFCAWLSANDRSMAGKVTAALKESLGEEMASLVITVPSLASMLGDEFDSEQQNNESDDVVDAQKRLRYLFCQFVEVISKCHEEPIILFLDDCQWIDDASVALLNEILIMSGSAVTERRLFFFGSCRDDEMGETHPLNVMLDSVGSSFGTKITKIHLTPLSKDALNELVSSALSLLPRIVRPLSNVLHHKTKGSPLFVKQVMMELCKQRLLYPSLSRRRWVWETDKILDMKIPENVASFITKSFDRLPTDLISALVVLSCFGARSDVSLIEVLENEIHQPLISPLNEAVAHSVLGRRNGEFYFMHDKLQEAAYNMMTLEERSLQHNRCGLALGFVAARDKNDRMLLTAVGQINHGGPQAVIDGEQAMVVATLNLDAGKKALKMSDFFSAYSFFNYGISNLQRDHWNETYNLSLELYNLAAKCALMNAEHENFKTLSGQVMHNSRCFEDKCQAISNTITLLGKSGNGPEAIELIKSTLMNLGEGLPKNIKPSMLKSHLDTTKAQLAVLSNDVLLNCSTMVNPTKLLAVELLAKLYQILAYAGEKASMMIIPLKIIQISLAHGICQHSPVGFAQYGNYLAFIRNEFGEGHRYVKVALSMREKIQCRAQYGAITYYANHTKLHVEPMQSAIELYLDAYKASMKSGHPYAIELSLVYVNFCFWSGKKLDAVIVSFKETMKEAKYHKNLIMLTMLLPMFRMSLRLMGQSCAPQQEEMVNAFGETCKIDDITGRHTVHLHTIFFVRLSEALIFREIDEAREATEKYFSIDQSTGSHFTLSMPTMFFRRFYAGLASFWIGREADGRKSKKWIARGVECKDAIEKLASSASEWNFQNKAYLLQAEEQFCRMNFELAEQLYDLAISSSKTHKFLNEEALANELAGHFYLDTGRRDASVHYFSQAFDKYNEWGAIAKANMLKKYLDAERMNS